MRGRLALVLLGGASQLVGAAIFLFGVWRCPDGAVAYRFMCALLSAAFLAYFYLCARRFARVRRCGAWFFTLPTVALLLSVFARGVHGNPVTSALVSGLALPFHALLPTLQFAFDRYLLLPKALPVLLCALAFWLGGQKRRRRRRGAALLCAVLLALTLCPIPCATRNASDGDAICVMRIYSDPPVASLGLLAGGTGHTFLTFQNISSAPITVGRHTVAPEAMVSIGKFATLDGHSGTFYNAETNRASRLGWYTGARSLGMELTAEQLATVSACLNAHESGYLWVGSNCATLSAFAWNSVLRADDPRYIVHSATPAQVYRDITAALSYLDGNGLLQADYPLCYFDGTTKVLCDDYA